MERSQEETIVEKAQEKPGEAEVNAYPLLKTEEVVEMESHLMRNMREESGLDEDSCVKVIDVENAGNVSVEAEQFCRDGDENTADNNSNDVSQSMKLGAAAISPLVCR